MEDVPTEDTACDKSNQLIREITSKFPQGSHTNILLPTYGRHLVWISGSRDIGISSSQLETRLGYKSYFISGMLMVEIFSAENIEGTSMIRASCQYVIATDSIAQLAWIFSRCGTTFDIDRFDAETHSVTLESIYRGLAFGELEEERTILVSHDHYQFQTSISAILPRKVSLYHFGFYTFDGDNEVTEPGMPAGFRFVQVTPSRDRTHYILEFWNPVTDAYSSISSEDIDGIRLHPINQGVVCHKRGVFRSPTGKFISLDGAKRRRTD